MNILNQLKNYAMWSLDMKTKPLGKNVQLPSCKKGTSS